MDLAAQSVGVATGTSGPTGHIKTIASGAWQHTLDVNLTGMFHCVQRAAPLMKANRNGAIVNIASAVGTLPVE